MWHKPCRTFNPWCLCIKTRCLCPIDSLPATRLSWRGQMGSSRMTDQISTNETTYLRTVLLICIFDLLETVLQCRKYQYRRNLKLSSRLFLWCCRSGGCDRGQHWGQPGHCVCRDGSHAPAGMVWLRLPIRSCTGIHEPRFHHVWTNQRSGLAYKPRATQERYRYLQKCNHLAEGFKKEGPFLEGLASVLASQAAASPNTIWRALACITACLNIALTEG